MPAIEFRCQFQLPDTPEYTALINYLKSHPEKPLKSLLLEALRSFHLPFALLEQTDTPDELLWRCGWEAVYALEAKAGLLRQLLHLKSGSDHTHSIHPTVPSVVAQPNLRAEGDELLIHSSIEPESATADESDNYHPVNGSVPQDFMDIEFNL